MKAIIIIITAVLTLQAFSLFAFNADTKSGSNHIKTTITEMNALAPVTPAEASFEDAAVITFASVDVVAFAPVSPIIATFEDDVETGSGLVLIDLAPVTRLEVDFNDFMTPEADVTFLSPITPLEVDFENLL